MAASSIPTVKAAILALLNARDGLDGVGITWAHPGVDLIEHESIFFYDDPQHTEADRQLGNGKRRETYTLPLTVTVYGEGDPTGQETEERMWALVAEVETALRENNNLGIATATTQVISATVGGFQPHNYFEAGKRISECDVLVNVQSDSK